MSTNLRDAQVPLAQNLLPDWCSAWISNLLLCTVVLTCMALYAVCPIICSFMIMHYNILVLYVWPGHCPTNFQILILVVAVTENFQEYNCSLNFAPCCSWCSGKFVCFAVFALWEQVAHTLCLAGQINNCSFGADWQYLGCSRTRSYPISTCSSKFKALDYIKATHLQASLTIQASDSF